jgi:hypothetical protein
LIPNSLSLGHQFGSHLRNLTKDHKQRPVEGDDDVILLEPDARTASLDHTAAERDHQDLDPSLLQRLEDRIGKDERQGLSMGRVHGFPVPVCAPMARHPACLTEAEVPILSVSALRTLPKGARRISGDQRSRIDNSPAAD